MRIAQVDPERYVLVRSEWIAPAESIWSNRIEDAYDKRIFVLDVEEIDKVQAYAINSALEEYEPYLGARIIEPESPIRVLYSQHLLVPKFEMDGNRLWLGWDGIDEDGKDEGLAARLRELPFENVGFKVLEEPLDDLLDELMET